MRVLLSFQDFAGFGGTETYTVTVAHHLDRLGHDAAIYSATDGVMAVWARENGIAVLSASQLPPECDLAIVSDTAACHDLAGRYGDAVVVFVAHSAEFMSQAPPQVRDRCQAIVVLNDRVRRAVEARGWHAPVVRLRQPIDLLTYGNLGPSLSVARTVLVSSNYVEGQRARVIEDGCRARGLEVHWIGSTTRSTATPEFDIAGAEIVIGLGRTALEAMAAGRAAYVYGPLGGDGWVTAESYPAMEADGFAGSSSPEVLIDAHRLADDLARWDERMGETNRDLISAHHDAREHAIALVDLARNLNPSPPVQPSPDEEFARMIRLQARGESRATTSQAEAARLRSALAELELEAATLRTESRALRTQLAQAEATLNLLRRTRRYRLASRIAAPLDWLRDASSGG